MGYSKKHLVICEDINGTRNRFITVAFDNEPHVSKHLSVRLSDDEDLYFLYTVNISETDFATIKSQQGLLVDFSGFRQRVIALLEQCSKEEQTSVPKYMLKFTRSLNEDRSGVLQIVEATNFKYLTHLSLTLMAGDDETLKAYLVGQLKELKIESRQKIEFLEKSISELSSKLFTTEKNYSAALDDLESLKSSYRTQEATLKNELKEKLEAVEEKHEKIESDLKEALHKEQRQSAEALEDVRIELTTKLEDCRRANRDLTETRDRLQTNVRELTGQVATLETENASSRELLTSTRSQLRSVEQICQNQSATISRLENRLATLEQDVALKEESVVKLQETLNSEREAKGKLQDALQTQTSCNDKLQKSLDKETEEVKKANEIIKHLQSEVKSHHTKAKLRGQVAAEQERLLSAKESELNDRSNEVERLRAELRKASDNLASLTEQLNGANKELSDAQKTIKTNENIIGWLNRQISENQIGQVQQRLRSSGLVTPATNFAPLPSYTPTQIGVTNGKCGVSVAPPPWSHPSAALNNPSNTIISRSTNVAHPSVPYSSTANGNAAAPKQLPSSHPAVSVAGDKNDPTFNHVKFPTNPDSQLPTAPVPITKSTPVSNDQLAKPVTSNMGPGAAATRLPSYIPSTIVSKVRGSTTVDAGKNLPESDHIIQQQSLTSAYFPKPVVGTGARS